MPSSCYEPVLIPGPVGALCVTVDHLQLDLGSVGTGYGDKPWCTGKQLPLGFSLTGPKKGINEQETGSTKY